MDTNIIQQTKQLIFKIDHEEVICNLFLGFQEIETKDEYIIYHEKDHPTKNKYAKVKRTGKYIYLIKFVSFENEVIRKVTNLLKKMNYYTQTKPEQAKKYGQKLLDFISFTTDAYPEKATVSKFQKDMYFENRDNKIQYFCCNAEVENESIYFFHARFLKETELKTDPLQQVNEDFNYIEFDRVYFIPDSLYNIHFTDEGDIYVEKEKCIETEMKITPKKKEEDDETFQMLLEKRKKELKNMAQKHDNAKVLYEKLEQEN